MDVSIAGLVETYHFSGCETPGRKSRGEYIRTFTALSDGPFPFSHNFLSPPIPQHQQLPLLAQCLGHRHRCHASVFFSTCTSSTRTTSRNNRQLVSLLPWPSRSGHRPPSRWSSPARKRAGKLVRLWDAPLERIEVTSSLIALCKHLVITYHSPLLIGSCQVFFFFKLLSYF